jgi:hypothetical protein
MNVLVGNHIWRNSFSTILLTSTKRLGTGLGRKFANQTEFDHHRPNDINLAFGVYTLKKIAIFIV